LGRPHFYSRGCLFELSQLPFRFFLLPKGVHGRFRAAHNKRSQFINLRPESQVIDPPAGKNPDEGHRDEDRLEPKADVE
jgi:hypothetical protein